MSENEQAAGNGQAAEGGQIVIQKIYIKDASFEVPGAPGIFQEQGQMDVNLNLSQKAQPVGDDHYEVVLTVTVTTKVGDKTAYLVEVQQAGIFGIRGLEQPQVHAALGIFCPNTLYPYARQAISEMVSLGGFPPLVMQHVNFEAIYAEQMQKQQEQKPN